MKKKILSIEKNYQKSYQSFMSYMTDVDARERILVSQIEIMMKNTTKIISSNEFLFKKMFYLARAILNREKREFMKQMIEAENENEIQTQIQTVMIEVLDSIKIDNLFEMQKTSQSYIRRLKDD